MSTTQGSVTVAFPGFPAFTMNTVNEQIHFPTFYWGYKSARFLPKRTVEFCNGKKRRLSKKERSRLRTLAKEWNKSGRKGRPFRTLHEESY